MINKMLLPYSINAIEPYYNAETLSIHYNTLYTGYVNNTNKVLEKLSFARKNNDFENIKCLERELSFQGSGVILHELFFENIIPSNSTLPSGILLNQINKDFGGYDKFKKQFSEASRTVEASGWCILAWVPRFKRLEILQCEKHQDLTLWGCVPILVLDMWEHSYFMQYKADRAKYIEAFWNIVNWNVVKRRFENIFN